MRQVAFHMQTVDPPLLPRLCDLFDESPDAMELRPLHEGRPHRPGALEVHVLGLRPYSQTLSFD